MQREKILVVDDEREIGELIRDYLEREGFEVILAPDGQDGLAKLRREKPVMAVLDIMLPKLDGMELCRIVRNESTIPILMLSARKSDVDKILGLGLGADDYVTKPFSPAELVARVKAQIRRYTLLSATAETKGIIRYGGLELDSKGYSVFLSGEKIDLSAKEFEILHYLMLHPRQVLTRQQIFDHVWGYSRELLENILSDLELEDRNKIIHIERPIPSVKIQADRYRIAQVVNNLIENARRYAGEHGLIRVASRIKDGRLVVSVADNGPGISAANLPHIFERFYRGEKSRSREYGGTGLGLAICKHIIEAHGGEIRAESTAGEGSTFYFTVPLG